MRIFLLICVVISSFSCRTLDGSRSSLSSVGGPWGRCNEVAKRNLNEPRRSAATLYFLAQQRGGALAGVAAPTLLASIENPGNPNAEAAATRLNISMNANQGVEGNAEAAFQQVFRDIKLDRAEFAASMAERLGALDEARSGIDRMADPVQRANAARGLAGFVGAEVSALAAYGEPAALMLAPKVIEILADGTAPGAPLEALRGEMRVAIEVSERLSAQSGQADARTKADFALEANHARARSVVALAAAGDMNGAQEMYKGLASSTAGATAAEMVKVELAVALTGESITSALYQSTSQRLTGLRQLVTRIENVGTGMQGARNQLQQVETFITAEAKKMAEASVPEATARAGEIASQISNRLAIRNAEVQRRTAESVKTAVVRRLR
jgi:hypothetical protein